MRERGWLKEETARLVVLTPAGGISVDELAAATENHPQTASAASPSRTAAAAQPVTYPVIASRERTPGRLSYAEKTLPSALRAISLEEGCCLWTTAHRACLGADTWPRKNADETCLCHGWVELLFDAVSES